MNTNELLKTILLSIAFLLFLGAYIFYRQVLTIDYLDPVVELELVPDDPTTIELVVPEPEPTPTPRPTPSTYFEGEASYYSREGCIGCSPTLTMANGEPLDDGRLTLAFNHAPMNTQVRVCNLATNSCIEALVTDTGGFGKLNRIADLTVATRDAIQCSSLCQVSVQIL